MLGVLVECDPKKPGVHGQAIYYEGIPGKYGRFEHPRTAFEEIEIMEKFEHEMIRRYGERRVPATFLPPWEPKNTEIKDVIFNNPATIVLWKDGTKTVVKCQEGDTYSKELGLAMCISKKYLGNKGNFNEVFKKWIPDETPEPTAENQEPEEDIDIEEKKRRLSKFCFGRSCIGCTLELFPCGGYTSFIDSIDAVDYVLSDDEIREAYKLIKNKEDK